jgi:hypothetical protein
MAGERTKLPLRYFTELVSKLRNQGTASDRTIGTVTIAATVEIRIAAENRSKMISSDVLKYRNGLCLVMPRS